MAVQRWLGLLPKWRTGIGSADPNHPAAVRIYLRAGDVEHSFSAGDPGVKGSWTDLLGAYVLIEVALWHRQNLLLWSVPALA